MSKKKRRGDRRVQWTTSAAARHALRLKQDMLANHRGNPFVHAMAANNARQTIEHWRDLEEAGGTPRQRIWMGLNELAGLNLDPDTPDLPKLSATQMLTDEHDTIEAAETYVVSPGMHAAAVAAAQTLDTEDLMTLPVEDDAPSPAGFLVLPSVQLVDRAGRDDARADVRAFTWRASWVANNTGGHNRLIQIVTWVATDGPLQVAAFTTIRRMATEQGHPLPGLVAEYHNYLNVTPGRQLTDEQLRDVVELSREMHDKLSRVDAEGRQYGELVGEYTGDVVDDTDGQFASRYLYAFWRLCAQRIVTVNRRGELDGPGTAPSSTEEEDVRIVQLRSFSPYAEDDSADHGRTYKHRWIVRMHKVRQWYPSEQAHKIIWRGPYIKGPPDAPLLTGEHVNALVR